MPEKKSVMIFKSDFLSLTIKRSLMNINTTTISISHEQLKAKGIKVNYPKLRSYELVALGFEQDLP